jgi:DivIVA domain-containing protein
VDGETNENAEQPVTDDGTAEQLTAAQLVDYLTRASFTTTIGRRGYHQGEVAALLKRLTEAVQEGEPLADLVRRTKLTTVRLEDGYDQSQVDDFLAAVVDLDPHPAVKPEIARTGLVAKLFG